MNVTYACVPPHTHTQRERRERDRILRKQRKNNRVVVTRNRGYYEKDFGNYLSKNMTLQAKQEKYAQKSIVQHSDCG